MSKRVKIGFAIVAVVLLFAAGLFVTFLRFVKVPSAGMANTIVPGDHLVIAPIFGDIERGDIIEFKYPKEPSIRYVKRVIGLPGETIQVRDKKVFINGSELAEARVYVEYDFETMPMKEVSSEGSGSYRVYYYKPEDESFTDSYRLTPYAGREPFQIPDGHYFVLGDNRDNSEDSRYWGAVPGNLIVGKFFTKY